MTLYIRNLELFQLNSKIKRLLIIQLKLKTKCRVELLKLLKLSQGKK